VRFSRPVEMNDAFDSHYLVPSEQWVFAASSGTPVFVGQLACFLAGWMAVRPMPTIRRGYHRGTCLRMKREVFRRAEANAQAPQRQHCRALLFQISGNEGELVEGGLHVFDDFGCNHIRVGKIGRVF
jgi:hypothetical protein